MSFPALHLVPAGVCLLLAVGWDVARRRIPNAVVGATALSGIIVQMWDKGLVSALSGLAAGVLTVALLYRAWLAGGIGGGDVKLAGAVAVWTGLGRLPHYLVVGAFAGGFVALVCFWFSRREVRREVVVNLKLAVMQQRVPDAPTPTKGRVSVPYALAIAAGGAFALWGG